VPEVLSADDYVVMVRPEGPYRDYTRRELQVTERGLDLRIALHPQGRGTVSGLIRDTEGNPIPGFTLSVGSTSATRLVRQFTSDVTGRFFVDDVPTGDLLFETRSYPRLTVRGIRLRPNTEEVVELVLDWGEHRVAGQVVDSSSRPIAGGKVWLSMEYFHDGVQSRSTRMTTADADGLFAFTGLGPGRHLVRVDAPGFQTASLEREIRAPIEQITVLLD
jgi:hypothetical protein